MTDVHEPPARLIALADQRIAQIFDEGSEIFDALKDLPAQRLIIASLTEPRDDNDVDWEKTCDVCGRVLGEGEELIAGSVSGKQRGILVELRAWACEPCVGEET